MKRLKALFFKTFQFLETHVNRPWYPYVLGAIFLVDHFLPIVPLDGIFITSVLAAKRRWIALFVSASVGFSLGATLFAYFVKLYGLALVEKLSPGITHHAVWLQSEAWMNHYGLFAVGGLSMVPLTLHPLVAMAALNQTSMLVIFLAVFVGRFLRYGVLAYLTIHAPDAVFKFKPFRKEVEILEEPAKRS